MRMRKRMGTPTAMETAVMLSNAEEEAAGGLEGEEEEDEAEGEGEGEGEAPDAGAGVEDTAEAAVEEVEEGSGLAIL